MNTSAAIVIFFLRKNSGLMKNRLVCAPTARESLVVLSTPFPLFLKGVVFISQIVVRVVPLIRLRARRLVKIREITE